MTSSYSLQHTQETDFVPFACFINVLVLIFIPLFLIMKPSQSHYSCRQIYFQNLKTEYESFFFKVQKLWVIDFRGLRSTHSQMNLPLIYLKQSFPCVIDRNLWYDWLRCTDKWYSVVAVVKWHLTRHLKPLGCTVMRTLTWRLLLAL